MATATDTLNGTAEAVQFAQDALRRYLDEAAAAGRSAVAAWNATLQGTLQAAFDFQDAGLQASRALFDATVQTNRSLIDQWVEATRQSRAATLKLVDAGVRLLEATLPHPRS